MRIETEEQLRGEIWKIVHSTPAFDMDTHLPDPTRKGDDIPWGMDALLTQPDLRREVFRFDPRQPDAIHESITPEAFAALPERIQADIIWHRCFLAHTPLTAATDNVLTTLGMHGLDPGTRCLADYRAYFKDRSLKTHLDHLFHLANLEAVVLSMEALDALDCAETKPAPDPRIKTALSLDRLLHGWSESAARLEAEGYGVTPRPIKKASRELQRFLRDAVDATNPVCLRLTLPSSFDCKKKSTLNKFLAKAVIPLCLEEALPLHIRIGTPCLDSEPAEDADATPSWIAPFCCAHPGVRILISARTAQEQVVLTRAAAVCPNLMPCGTGIQAMHAAGDGADVRRRLGELGLSFVPQSSGAWVWDQLPGTWAYIRWQVALVLQDAYAELYRTGWRVHAGELQRDIYNLFNGNLKTWMGLDA